MRWVYLVLLLVIVTIVVVFVVDNNKNTTVKLFRQSLTAPLSWFFVAVYFLGMRRQRRRLRQAGIPPRYPTRGAEVGVAGGVTPVHLMES